LKPNLQVRADVNGWFQNGARQFYFMAPAGDITFRAGPAPPGYQYKIAVTMETCDATSKQCSAPAAAPLLTIASGAGVTSFLPTEAQVR
jgi:hypothetical protein